MSLITEALRKARQEAADREGRQRGIPRGLAVPPKRWGTGRSLAVALLVVAAAIAGGAVTWWTLARRAPGAVASTPSALAAAPAPATEARPHTDQAPGPGDTRANPPSAPAGPEPGARGKTRGAPPAQQTPVLAAPPAPAGAPEPTVVGAQPPSDREGAPAERQQRHPNGGPRDRTFVVDADLGSVKLHLDYVVYRPGSPFAGINGQQVVIGTTIEGLEVEEISPEAVRLRDARGTVTLRTH